MKIFFMILLLASSQFAFASEEEATIVVPPAEAAVETDMPSVNLPPVDLRGASEGDASKDSPADKPTMAANVPDASLGTLSNLEFKPAATAKPVEAPKLPEAPAPTSTENASIVATPKVLSLKCVIRAQSEGPVEKKRLGEVIIEGATSRTFRTYKRFEYENSDLKNGAPLKAAVEVTVARSSIQKAEAEVDLLFKDKSVSSNPSRTRFTFKLLENNSGSTELMSPFGTLYSECFML